MGKRKVQVVVISDVHLGTYGCHATELKEYLKSIDPDHLILNGDIIDIWQFRKRYFPKTHLKVIKTIVSMASKGTKVSYITGNHDEMLRKFSSSKLGNIALVDKLVLNLNGARTWIFHGDVFDASIQHSKWLAKLGGWGYDILILLNRLINWFLLKLGREKYSLSKRIKESVKSAVKFINDFETTATDLAIQNNYDTVICGHIHQPQKRVVRNLKGSTLYLNSGDWIENLTSLEYNDGSWQLIHHTPNAQKESVEEDNMDLPTPEMLVQLVTAHQTQII